jgi:methylmalonyl-CoA mutase cobalamin-binding subunit
MLFSISGWKGRTYVDSGMRQLASALRDSSARVHVGALVRATDEAITHQALRSAAPHVIAAVDAGALLGDAARLSRGLARAAEVLARLS